MWLKDRLQEFLFPNNACIFCARENVLDANTQSCASCRRILPYLHKATCIRGVEVYSVFLYKKPVRECILSFKLQNNRYMAKPLAYFLSQAYGGLCTRAQIAAPVPMHEKKRRERGYNQSWLLCAALGNLCGIAAEEACLIKTKETVSQTELNERQRAENVKGVFRADGRVEGKSVLLIDDVVTTGSTLYECAHALYRAGAKEVNALTLAKR